MLPRRRRLPSRGIGSRDASARPNLVYPPPMPAREVGFWLALVPIGYAALLARGPLGAGSAMGLALALGAALALVFRITRAPPAAPDPAAPAVRASARTAGAAGLLLVASRAGVSTPALDAFAGLAALVASLSGLVALSLVGRGETSAPRARRLAFELPGAVLLAWTVAIALPIARGLAPERTRTLHPDVDLLATSAAATLSLAALALVSARALFAQRFELGASERLEAALGAAVTAAVAAAVTAASGLAPVERALPVAAVVAAIAATTAATVRDAAALGRSLRIGLAFVPIAGPLTAVAAFAGRRAPEHAPLVGAAALVAGALAGLVAPALARRFFPAPERLRRASERALAAARRPDPELALEAALGALEQGLATPRHSQGMVTIHLLPSGETLSVDRAGYMQRGSSVPVPEGLVALAESAPMGLVFYPRLLAERVRKPDRSALAAWMEARGAAVVVRLADDGGTFALLTLAQGTTTAWMTLAEASAIRAVAERLGALLGVVASLARSRERELEARRTIAETTRDGDLLRATLEAERSRDEDALRAAATRLGRTLYAPASRDAATRLVASLRAGGPLVLLAPPGCVVLPWLAYGHVGAERAGTLVVVNGLEASAPDALRASGPRSLRDLARGGTIAVLEPQALAPEHQGSVAELALGDAALVLVVPATVDALVAAGRLDERVADRVGGSAVLLPPLAARSEDLRALVLDELARLGLTLRGAPLGIEDEALAKLLAHPFPDNDAELAALLLRAAQRANGLTVRARDLELAPEPLSNGPPWPAAATSRIVSRPTSRS
jgi:hypothetical protein